MSLFLPAFTSFSKSVEKVSLVIQRRPRRLFPVIVGTFTPQAACRERGTPSSAVLFPYVMLRRAATENLIVQAI
ncbi:MAG: hypothetical protein H5T68_12260 [Chloroflexi bacterium]|nr:hypothetical protein [Chloroflexota bacterium]